MENALIFWSNFHLNNLRHSLSEKTNPIRSSIPRPPSASAALRDAWHGESVAGRSDFPPGRRPLWAGSQLLTSAPVYSFSPILKSSNQLIIYPFPQLFLDLDQTQPSRIQHFYFLDSGDMLRGIASVPTIGPRRNQNALKLFFPEPECRFRHIELLADLLNRYGLFVGRAWGRN